MFVGECVVIRWVIRPPAMLLTPARNVGNVVPHFSVGHCDPATPATEPALLELGVVLLGIKHVVLCGHSDCKVKIKC